MENSSTTLTLNQRIMTLYQSGMTSAAQIYRRISRSVKVSQRTVERKVNILKRGESFQKTERKQRNDKFLTKEIAQEIEEYLKDNPTATAVEIIEYLNYNVSIRTMRRSLKELGYNYASTLKVPFMTSDHIGDRLWFAHDNLRRRWDNAVFVDECTFVTHSYPKKAYQKRGRRLTYQCPKKIGKVHVWGGICTRGKVSLHIFTENLNGLLYKKILGRKLLPSMRRLYGGGKWILVQDNDPKHTCGKVAKFLNKHNIEVIQRWPASSPDLNPIENIWSIMKSDISKVRPKTIEELIEAIKISWRLLRREYILNCINSMPNRLQLLLNNNGQKIPY